MSQTRPTGFKDNVSEDDILGALLRAHTNIRQSSDADLKRVIEDEYLSLASLGVEVDDIEGFLLGFLKKREAASGISDTDSDIVALRRWVPLREFRRKISFKTEIEECENGRFLIVRDAKGDVIRRIRIRKGNRIYGVDGVIQCPRGMSNC